MNRDGPTIPRHAPPRALPRGYLLRLRFERHFRLHLVFLPAALVLPPLAQSASEVMRAQRLDDAVGSLFSATVFMALALPAVVVWCFIAADVVRAPRVADLLVHGLVTTAIVDRAPFIRLARFTVDGVARTTTGRRPGACVVVYDADRAVVVDTLPGAPRVTHDAVIAGGGPAVALLAACSLLILGAGLVGVWARMLSGFVPFLGWLVDFVDL